MMDELTEVFKGWKDRQVKSNMLPHFFQNWGINTFFHISWCIYLNMKINKTKKMK